MNKSLTRFLFSLVVQTMFSLVDAKLVVNPRRVEFGQMDMDVAGMVPSMAINLEREMTMGTPTMAIDQINITGKTPIEMHLLQNALMLIPLVFCADKTIDDYVYKADCTCVNPHEGCAKCSVEFTIKVSSGTQQHFPVTTAHLVCPSGSLMPMDIYRFHLIRNDPKRFTAAQLELYSQQKPAVLFHLAPYQEILVRALARKGTGRQNGKWIPASVAGYRKGVHITLSDSILSTLRQEQKQEFVDSCDEQHVFRMCKRKEWKSQGEKKKETKGKKSTKLVGRPKDSSNAKALESDGLLDWIEIADGGRNCIYCLRCCDTAEKMGKPDLVRIEKVDTPHRYRWFFEYRNQANPWDTVLRGIASLRAQLNKIRTHVETHQSTYEQAENQR